MVRAAVAGETLDFTQPPSRAYEKDGVDLCIGTGKATTYGDLAAAIKSIIPHARFDLPTGYDPQGSGRVFELDITRIREDTGFAPQYDLQRAVADYISWLRAGNAE
jgi:UDP-glucose 4-epimerase